jgi:hypothetical protein
LTIKDDIWVSPLKYFHAEMSEGEPYGQSEVRVDPKFESPSLVQIVLLVEKGSVFFSKVKAGKISGGVNLSRFLETSN